ncbi:hypothetical protein L7F22_022433 [Adiantum nelumboides]|nr:hypothetical protein [Adiantum nelumboides]
MQSHYGKIFAAPLPLTHEACQARHLFLSHVTSIVSAQQAHDLEVVFNESELHAGLLNLGRWKTLGWDGLTVEFFLSFWENLKFPLLTMMNMAWDQQQLPSSWKEGLFKLIPKQALCEEFSHWRPITLMPVIYKLMAKMIVNRLKSFLHNGLHQSQYGFIPRRQIIDNLANVLIGMEYAKYTQQDVLVMQVDIEKAFDTVLWDYIADTMKHLGFGPKLSNVVFFL